MTKLKRGTARPIVRTKDVVATDAPLIDWDRLSLEAVNAILAQAEKAKSTLQAKAKAALLSEFAVKAAALGFTLEEVVAKTPGPRARPRGRTRRDTSAAPVVKQKAPIKYRGPQGETWSGHGIAPRWIKELERQGRTRDQFAV
jgi:DNA-binding protein H-NS